MDPNEAAALEAQRRAHESLEELVERAKKVQRGLAQRNIPISVADIRSLEGTANVQIQVSGWFFVAVGELLLDALRDGVIDEFKPRAGPMQGPLPPPGYPGGGA